MSIEQINEELLEEMASGVHGEIGAIITGSLVAYVYPKKLGRVFNAQTSFEIGGIPPKRQPDVAFVTLSRMPTRIDEDVPFAPDLAVEVISRNDDWSEIIGKVRQYQQAGVSLIWVIDPYGREVFVYHQNDPLPRLLGPTEQLDGENIVPGFKLDVSILFE